MRGAPRCSRLVIPRGSRISIAIRMTPKKNDWKSPRALGSTTGTTVCRIWPSATTTAAPITAPHRLRSPPITDISTKFTDSKKLNEVGSMYDACEA